ncbi:MFS transporter [Streptomyces sp. NBC_00038]|uniref:MFS transporter n=1 Tax=Streptomyces sp. NBC_00038 TaxID=2903615 RepID=UPI002255C4C9|nr:MFS transporter [Streptomyces sp. NBC_00038]MCX5557205.1 MFS transporter [Streptomyces sp. NBC_00038]
MTPEDLATTAIPTPPDLTPRRRAQALLICIAAAFLTLLDVSIVTVALPSMEEHLHLTPADVTWSLAGYTLTFGLMLVPAGRLGDEFGRRKIFVIGMVLFIVTGVLCGVAPDAVWLDAARLARGVAAGLVAPQVVGLLHQMYPARERGRAFGYYGATVSLSTAIGPLLGGVILHVFGTGEGWRWVFFAFIPLDVVVLFLALRLLPQGHRVEARRTLDLVGVLVLGLAVTAVMLPLLQSGDWVDRRWWLTWTGLALLVVFVLRERAVARQGRQPLVDLNLFRERHYWVGTLVAASLYGGFTGIFIVLTQFLQQGLGYTALHAALSIVAFTVGSAVCGVISGRIVHRVGPPLVIGGTAVTAVGLAATALVVGGSSGSGHAHGAAARRTAPGGRLRRRLRHRGQPDPRPAPCTAQGGQHRGRGLPDRHEDRHLARDGAGDLPALQPDRRHARRLGRRRADRPHRRGRPGRRRLPRGTAGLHARQA